MPKIGKKFCGECIFCTSKCPKCDSTHIGVSFRIALDYVNNQKDRIEFDWDYWIHVKCYDCDKEFENDAELDALESSIFDLLNEYNLPELPNSLQVELNWLHASEGSEAQAEQILKSSNWLWKIKRLWISLREALDEEGDADLLFTRELAEDHVVKDLEKHRLMPEYRVFDDEE